MKVLILNSILFTADNYRIPKVKTIKDTMIYSVCLGFKELGHEVTLVAADDYRPTDNEDYDFEVLFFHSCYKRVFSPSVIPFSKELRKFLKDNQKNYDMVVSSEIFSFPSLFASCICNQKLVVWHELAVYPRKFCRIPSRIWYDVVVPKYFKSTFVVARSVAAKSFISKHCKNVSDIVVEHGVNIDRFVASKTKNKQFVVISQLIPRKNIQSIIRKFKQFVELSEENRAYKLYIIGRGPLEDTLKELVAELHLSKNVVFVGFLGHDELKVYLSESMAMLIDTFQDNNMVSIPESIVSGTPVLTNSVPTNKYTIIANDLGIVKDEWGSAEIERIVTNNDYYVNRCVDYRDKLSYQYCASQLIKAFNNRNNKS